MSFSNRVFCRDLSSPSLSEVLVWLRQHEYPTKIGGGQSAGDLLSNFWDDVQLSVHEDEGPLRVKCYRADAASAARLAEEIADFAADVRELPESEGRTRVLEHLSATRSLVVVEFPPEGSSAHVHETAESILALFAERAGGLAQRDGVGFLDEDDEVVLVIG